MELKCTKIWGNHKKLTNKIMRCFYIRTDIIFHKSQRRMEQYKIQIIKLGTITILIVNN